MSKPDGFLFRGSAFSSKQSAIEILVHSREQELRFHETWEKEAKPYFFNDNQPKLSIPKKIADMLDEGDLMLLAWTHGNDLLGKVPDEERKAEIIRRNALARAYQAGKALGVELVSIEA